MNLPQHSQCISARAALYVDSPCPYLFHNTCTFRFRYVVQMLTPANIISKTNGRDEICKVDVQECDSLFIDAKASAKHLAAHSNEFIIG